MVAHPPRPTAVPEPPGAPMADDDRPPLARPTAPRIVPRSGPRVALVLGGGGLKGFAHLGVLRALRERGIRPAFVVGTSIGALLGAAWVGGTPLQEMTWRAGRLTRRDLFRLNHYQMLVGRMRAPSLYAPEPLRALVEQVCPSGTFADLATPMLVATVDVVRGTQVVWGLPGLREVPVHDAVYASCALPGFFPPGHVGGRVCVDGGTVDNLPVAVAAQGAGGPPVDAIIAVDVGNADLTHEESIDTRGFATIFMRSASVMMHALQGRSLQRWEGPPMLLIRPRVSHVGWFAFGHTEELVAEGYRAATAALRDLDAVLTAPGGIYPRRAVRLAVDRERCTGCGLCTALAPHAMGRDGSGKAYALTQTAHWSPADGDFVRHCPTAAIQATPADAGAALVLDDQEPAAPPPPPAAPAVAAGPVAPAPSPAA